MSPPQTRATSSSSSSSSSSSTSNQPSHHYNFDLKDTLTMLLAHFNNMFSIFLLYPSEWDLADYLLHECIVACECQGTCICEQVPLTPANIYGAAHLLRALLKLPDFLKIPEYGNLNVEKDLNAEAETDDDDDEEPVDTNKLNRELVVASLRHYQTVFNDIIQFVAVHKDEFLPVMATSSEDENAMDVEHAPRSEREGNPEEDPGQGFVVTSIRRRTSAKTSNPSSTPSTSMSCDAMEEEISPLHTPASHRNTHAAAVTGGDETVTRVVKQPFKLQDSMTSSSSSMAMTVQMSMPTSGGTQSTPMQVPPTVANTAKTPITTKQSTATVPVTTVTTATAVVTATTTATADAAADLHIAPADRKYVRLNGTYKKRLAYLRNQDKDMLPAGYTDVIAIAIDATRPRKVYAVHTKYLKDHWDDDVVMTEEEQEAIKNEVAVIAPADADIDASAASAVVAAAAASVVVAATTTAVEEANVDTSTKTSTAAAATATAAATAVNVAAANDGGNNDVDTVSAGRKYFRLWGGACKDRLAYIKNRNKGSIGDKQYIWVWVIGIDANRPKTKTSFSGKQIKEHWDDDVVMTAEEQEAIKNEEAVVAPADVNASATSSAVVTAADADADEYAVAASVVVAATAVEEANVDTSAKTTVSRRRSTAAATTTAATNTTGVATDENGEGGNDVDTANTGRKYFRMWRGAYKDRLVYIKNRDKGSIDDKQSVNIFVIGIDAARPSSQTTTTGKAIKDHWDDDVVMTAEEQEAVRESDDIIAPADAAAVAAPVVLSAAATAIEEANVDTSAKSSPDTANDGGDNDVNTASADRKYFRLWSGTLKGRLAYMESQPKSQIDDTQSVRLCVVGMGNTTRMGKAIKEHWDDDVVMTEEEQGAVRELEESAMMDDKEDSTWGGRSSVNHDNDQPSGTSESSAQQSSSSSSSTTKKGPSKALKRKIHACHDSDEINVDGGHDVLPHDQSRSIAVRAHSTNDTTSTIDVLEKVTFLKEVDDVLPAVSMPMSISEEQLHGGQPPQESSSSSSSSSTESRTTEDSSVLVPSVSVAVPVVALASGPEPVAENEVLMIDSPADTARSNDDVIEVGDETQTEMGSVTDIDSTAPDHMDVDNANESLSQSQSQSQYLPQTQPTKEGDGDGDMMEGGDVDMPMQGNGQEGHDESAITRMEVVEGEGSVDHTSSMSSIHHNQPGQQQQQLQQAVVVVELTEGAETTGTMSAPQSAGALMEQGDAVTIPRVPSSEASEMPMCLEIKKEMVGEVTADDDEENGQA